MAEYDNASSCMCFYQSHTSGSRQFSRRDAGSRLAIRARSAVGNYGIISQFLPPEVVAVRPCPSRVEACDDHP
jgi:hypothetical protein